LFFHTAAAAAATTTTTIIILADVPNYKSVKRAGRRGVSLCLASSASVSEIL
jgi:hypothetical protein